MKSVIRMLVILSLVSLNIHTTYAVAQDESVLEYIPAILSASKSTSTPTTEVPTVTSTNGRIWMDRNLGASRVATSPTDSLAYGDLYQWGRLADGHQSRTSPTTTTLSTTDIPGHGSFILLPYTGNDSPWDWRNPQNDTLWQGLSGINNPCPAGFRLPTEAEWEAEKASWSSNDAAGAFASPLRLVLAGGRSRYAASLITVGIEGYYWSSTVNGVLAYRLNIGFGAMGGSRAHAFSVRCIK